METAYQLHLKIHNAEAAWQDREHEKLAEAWPQDRSSVLALISAGRIQQRQLNQPQQGLRLYIAAQNSPVPHQDWNETIRKGVDTAMGKPKASTTEPASPPMAGSLQS